MPYHQLLKVSQHENMKRFKEKTKGLINNKTIFKKKSLQFNLFSEFPINLY